MALMGLDAIDKNFRVETSIKKDDLRFYDAEEGVFRIYAPSQVLSQGAG